METIVNRTTGYHPAMTPDLPDHILKQAAMLSDQAYAEGRYVMDEDVEEYISRRLGW